MEYYAAVLGIKNVVSVKTKEPILCREQRADSCFLGTCSGYRIGILNKGIKKYFI